MEQKASSIELMVIMASRLLENNSTIFVGVGLPMLASALAQRIHAPKMVAIFEGGSIGPEIMSNLMPYSTQETRLTHRALMLPSTPEMFAFAQRGFIDYGIIGGAQVDRNGNVNSSLINRGEEKIRLAGSGGANAVASLVKKTIVMIQHDKKRLVENVDFVTSPGNKVRNLRRHEHGLIFGEIWKIVTDLAIMSFDQNGEIFLEALYPGVSMNKVVDSTGFDLSAKEDVKFVESLTNEELETLRSLDPKRIYLR